MRAFVMLALLASGCAAASAKPGARYVAADVHHVVTTTPLARGTEESTVDAAVQSLRTAPGNLAVMLLRRDGQLTIVAEWRSVDDARRAGGELFEVLFEAAEFERLEEPSEEVPNSGSASSRRSGASSQIAARKP